MKIAYCGYDFFGGCLETILEEGHEVIQLFTQAPDNRIRFNDNVRKIAEKNNIPIYDKKPTEEMIRDLFVNKGCELLISAGFKYIVPTPEGVGFRGANVHPAMLPVGRGPFPMPVAIYTNEQNYGVSIHEISSKMDSGDIIIQESLTIHPTEDMDMLCCRCQMLAKKLVKDMLSDFDNYWQNRIPQSEEKAVYWELPTEEDKTITGNNTVVEADLKVRAFGKYGSIVVADDRVFDVCHASCWKENHSYPTGKIIHTSTNEMVISLKDGFICLRYFKELVKNENDYVEQ